MRIEEPGWIPLSVPDERRGIWIRITSAKVELCAGREGDDAYAVFEKGKLVTKKDIADVFSVLEYLAWALEVGSSNVISAITEHLTEGEP